MLCHIIHSGGGSAFTEGDPLNMKGCFNVKINSAFVSVFIYMFVY